MDEIIAVRGLRSPFVRMAKDGEVLPVRRFAGSGGTGAEISDQVITDRVFAELADGATLILQALHRTWPPLIEFVARLAAELGHPVQANAYLTPAGSRGFGAHHDVHDVFAVQLSGRKAWRIWTPQIESPLPTQPLPTSRGVAPSTDRPTALEITLGPGDVLYLPRGWVHRAESLDEPSLHLTIGVHAVTRYDVVQAMTSLLANDVRLRRSLSVPLQLDSVDESGLADIRQQVLDAVAELPMESLLQEVRRRVLPRRRPMPLRPLAQAVALGSVGHDTRVRRREALIARVEPRPESVAVVLADRVITLPPVTGDAVAALLSGEVHRAGDLPGLDAADGIVVVRRMLREAVVVPVV